MRIPRTLALRGAVLALVISACTPGESGSQSEAPDGTDGCRDAGDLDRIGRLLGGGARRRDLRTGPGGNGFTVDRHLELGERPAVRAAFDAGEINLAPYYLGGLAAFLELEVTSDADAVSTPILLFPALEATGTDDLDYSPGTDADGFAVRQETADDLSLSTLSDLAEVATTSSGAWPRAARRTRSAGRGCCEIYGIDISTLQPTAAAVQHRDRLGAEPRTPSRSPRSAPRRPTSRASTSRCSRDDKGLMPAQNLAPVLTRSWPMPAAMTGRLSLNSVSEC